MSRALLSTLVFIGIVGALLGWAWLDHQRKAPPPLQQAVEKGDVAAVERLVKSGADVNARSESRPPALVVAAENAKTETVRVLIQNGADRASRNEALAVAVRNCDFATVQVLLQSGADGNSLLKPDASGKSPYAELKERAWHRAVVWVD